MLAGADGGEVCIVWQPGQPQARVASGRYTIRTTRIERTKEKEHWFLSSCGPVMRKKKTVKLKRGENAFELDDTVHFKAVFRGWKQNNALLGFGLRGPDHRGLSVYKNDKRVPVTYQVLDKKGKILAQGRMNYG